MLERGREIGVLRAIGSSRRFAVSIVVTEAVGIGVVGASIGVFFDAIAHYLGSIALESVATIPVDYEISPWVMAYTTGALALCLLGAIPAARHAARVDIVEVIVLD